MKLYKLNTYLFMGFLLFFSGLTVAGSGNTKASLVNSGPPLPYRAQDDFYMYVNGSWLDSIANFSDEYNGKYSSTYAISSKHLSTLIDDCITHMVDNGQNNKIKVVYDGLTTKNEQIEEANRVTIQKFMEIIDRSSAFEAGGILDRFNEKSIANIEIYNGTKSADIAKALITQSVEANIPKNIKEIENTFNLINIKVNPDMALKVLQLEQTLHSPIDVMQNQVLEYNLSSLSKIWVIYLRNTGIISSQDKVMIDKDFYKLINNLSQDPDLWRLYFKFHFLYTYKNVISKAENVSDRRSMAFREIRDDFGNELNRLCFDPYLGSHKIQEIIDNIKKAYITSIDTSVWIKTPETKRLVADKISRMRIALGYPDYNPLGNKEYEFIGSDAIDPNQSLSNIIRIKEQSYQYTINKLNKPIVYVNWGSNELIYDGSEAYMPSQNAVVVPMFALLSPYFDPNKDQSFNYGGFGSSLGHEISHAFDEFYASGFFFGQLGTKEERNSLGKIVEKLADQHDLPNYYNRQGFEDIADNRSIEMALKAYHLSLNGQPVPMINGSSGNQWLYYNYAKVWQYGLYDDQWNVHSPARERVNIPLSNQSEFYEAYHVESRDNMYVPKEKRLKLW